jgi:hypothetical protein
MVRTTRHQAFQLPVCHSQRSGSSGKEANRWEEQFFLGMEEDAAIEYGTNPNATALFGELKVAIVKFGKPQVASRIGISRNSLTKSFDTKCQNLSPRLSQKIGSAIVVLNSEASEVKEATRFRQDRSHQNWTVGIRQTITGRCIGPEQNRGGKTKIEPPVGCEVREVF